MEKIKTLNIIFKNNKKYETFIIDSENNKIEEPIINPIDMEGECNTIYVQACYIVNNRYINDHQHINEEELNRRKEDFQEYYEIIIIFNRFKNNSYVIIKTKNLKIILHAYNYLTEMGGICHHAGPILEKLANIKMNTYYDFLNGISTK